MTRVLAAAVLGGLLAAGPVWADVPPPPGLKRVPLEYKIETEKEFPDYAFYAISGGDKAEPVKLDPKAPATVTAGGGRHRFATLVAVPKDAAKSFPGEKEFRAAVAAGKVEGMIKAKTGFSAFTTVKEGDPRKTIVERYQVEKVDPKDGIVLTPVKATEPARKSAPPPKGGLLAAGLAAAAAVMLGGLWLARRGRRASI